MKKKIFVVCVDRDDDLGRKTKVLGPVIGKENNLAAAQKLILADPTESDANTMFAALNKLEEARKEFKNAEIVTITGRGKIGLAADKEINRQLDEIQKGYIVEGWILITDGAEDNQVIPLLQSRGKIISTEQVIIKQAQAVESTFYTIKEALKDPGIARLFLGIPGLMLIAFVALGAFSIQAMSLILGAYLLLKGFGIEDKIVDYSRLITTSFQEQKMVSTFLYIAALIIPLIGLWLVYIQLVSADTIDPVVDLLSAFRTLLPFLIGAVFMIITGRAADSLVSKKAYKMGQYIMQATSVIAVWAIIDAGILVFLRQAEIIWFPANIMASFIILVIAMRIAKTFDVRDKITSVLIGLNVLDEEGNYLGKVVAIDKKKKTIQYELEKKKTEKEKGKFILKQGRIIVTA